MRPNVVIIIVIEVRIFLLLRFHGYCRNSFMNLGHCYPDFNMCSGSCLLVSLTMASWATITWWLAQMPFPLQLRLQVEVLTSLNCVAMSLLPKDSDTCLIFASWTIHLDVDTSQIPPLPDLGFPILNWLDFPSVHMTLIPTSLTACSLSHSVASAPYSGQASLCHRCDGVILLYVLWHWHFLFKIFFSFHHLLKINSEDTVYFHL